MIIRVATEVVLDKLYDYAVPAELTVTSVTLAIGPLKFATAPLTVMTLLSTDPLKFTVPPLQSGFRWPSM